ncbi:YaaC family protein [Lentibacillus saliphilus]|uniref:YaaC family protein n=1 Tax=Lentibacillus saliphilus TaxID=2737028 RepID=UPI001C307A8E|nr:YaaC family protein [Lentibacillus saliphilus]
MKQQHVHALYTYLQSQNSSRSYLLQCYKQLDGIDAEAKSYDNCTTFMYYLDHGHTFYNSGKKADDRLKPLLYFYGMVHLLKACILTVRPDYPESTTMLAHGVSSRKKKKKDYTFITDEVKVQHKGLLPYMSEHLFNLKQLPFTKITMQQLLAVIPELVPLYQWHKAPSMVQVGTLGHNELTFPQTLLDQYHLTEHGFLQKVQAFLPPITHQDIDHQMINIHLDAALLGENGPFYVNSTLKSVYFPIRREQFLPMSEVIVHYLILYNLGMLSRYEPAWWGELIATKPDMDYPLIKGFLDCTSDKIPLMLGEYLYRQYESKD